MKVTVLGSGSDGNSVFVEAAGTRVLVDAGLGPRVIEKRLARLGVDLFPRGIDAVVVTHQHGDHIAHLGSLLRAFRCPAYLHDGIEARGVRSKFDVRSYDTGRAAHVGSIAFEAVSVPHDAPQVALRLTARGASFGIATDVGRPSRELVRLFAQCDAALLEANHCLEMLATGPYPERLKRRVSGGLGHLSNDEAADIAAKLEGTRLRRLLLGHLSRTNNTPERALATVRARVRRLDVRVASAKEPCAIHVEAAGQLGLPFGI